MALGGQLVKQIVRAIVAVVRYDYDVGETNHLMVGHPFDDEWPFILLGGKQDFPLGVSVSQGCCRYRDRLLPGRLPLQPNCRTWLVRLLPA